MPRRVIPSTPLNAATGTFQALRGPEVSEGSYGIRTMPPAGGGTTGIALGQIHAYNLSTPGGPPTYEEHWTTIEPGLSNSNENVAPTQLLPGTSFELVEMGGADAWSVERERMLAPGPGGLVTPRFHSFQRVEWIDVLSQGLLEVLVGSNANTYIFDVHNLSSTNSDRRGCMVRQVQSVPDFQFPPGSCTPGNRDALVFTDTWYLLSSYQVPRGGPASAGGLVTRVTNRVLPLVGGIKFIFTSAIAKKLTITYAWENLVAENL